MLPLRDELHAVVRTHGEHQRLSFHGDQLDIRRDLHAANVGDRVRSTTWSKERPAAPHLKPVADARLDLREKTVGAAHLAKARGDGVQVGEPTRRKDACVRVRPGAH
jgi:hypothetical protein